MTNFPMTEQELHDIHGRLFSYVCDNDDFDVLHQIVEPDSELGKRFYFWLEENYITGDFIFLEKWTKLFQQARKDWQAQSN